MGLLVINTYQFDLKLKYPLEHLDSKPLLMLSKIQLIIKNELSDYYRGRI